MGNESSTLFSDSFDSGEPEILNGELNYRQIFEVPLDRRFFRNQPMVFQPLFLYAGESKEYILYVVDRDLVAIDLTGATGVMTFKQTKDSPVLFQLTGTLVAPAQGEMRFEMLPTDTASLSPRQYNYDVTIITASNKRYTVLEGVLTLKQPVNQ